MSQSLHRRIRALEAHLGTSRPNRVEEMTDDELLAVVEAHCRKAFGWNGRIVDLRKDQQDALLNAVAMDTLTPKTFAAVVQGDGPK